MSGGSGSKDTKKPLILLVEDDLHFVQAIRYYLEQRGFQVKVADNGVVGYMAFLDRRPDLLITDNALPRMMGFELVARIRKLDGGERLPVIMISAFDRMIGLDEEDRPLIDVFISKPFRLQELHRSISRLLETDSEHGRKVEEARTRSILHWRDPKRHPPRTRTPPPSRAELERLLQAEMDRATERIRSRGFPTQEKRPSLPAAPKLTPEPTRPEAVAGKAEGPRAASSLPVSIPGPSFQPKRSKEDGPPLRQGSQSDAQIHLVDGSASFQVPRLSEAEGAAPLPGRGSFQDISPADFLGRCLAHSVSGIVRFKCPQSSFSTIFRNGIPSYVETAGIEESFGAFLRREDAISEQSYNSYAERWSLGKRPPPARFIQQNNIPQSELMTLLLRYVDERMYDFLGWKLGSYSLLPDDSVLERWPDIHFNPIYLVFEWLRETSSNEDLIESISGPPGLRLRTHPGFGLHAELLAPLIDGGPLARPGVSSLLVSDFLGYHESNLRDGLLLLKTFVDLDLIELA